MRLNCQKIPLFIALEIFVGSNGEKPFVYVRATHKISLRFLVLCLWYEVQTIRFTSFWSTMSAVPIATIVPPGIEALVTSAVIPRWVSILCKG